MEFVELPPGRFQMGAPAEDLDADANERPARETLVERPLLVCRTALTLGEAYELVRHTHAGSCAAREPDEAANYVSWTVAMEVVRAMNVRRAGADRDVRYRLPTEVEWEYACRGGTSTRFFYGDDPTFDQLGEVAWYEANTWEVGHRRPRPVGMLRENPFGLYDVHGNVWEWTQDHWVRFPWEPLWPGPTRVLRGGGWCHPPKFLRASDRDHYDESYAHYYTGMRIFADTVTP